MADEIKPAGTPAGSTVQTPSPVVGTSTGENFVPQSASASSTSPSSTGAATGAAPATPASGETPDKGASGGKRLTLTPSDMRARLDRARSAELKELFGTDDRAAIKQRLQQIADLERQAEEQKRAQMTEQQRLQADLAKAQAERDRYRSELVMAQEREVVRQQGSFVEGIASRHVNSAALEEASLAFARHVSKTDPMVVARWTEKEVEAWFKGYVERKPFMAKGSATSQQQQPPPRRVERRAAGAASPPPRPSAPSGSAGAGGKTIRPGQPNSMTREEARAEARGRGYSW